MREHRHANSVIAEVIDEDNRDPENIPINELKIGSCLTSVLVS